MKGKCNATYDGIRHTMRCTREENHIGLHIWRSLTTTVVIRWREQRGCYRLRLGWPCSDEHGVNFR